MINSMSLQPKTGADAIGSIGQCGNSCVPNALVNVADMKIVALTFEILGTSHSRVFSHWFDAMDLRRSLRHSALNNGPSVFVNS